MPPVYKENLYADIFANPIAAKVLQNILGPKPQLRYLHGNTVALSPYFANLGSAGQEPSTRSRRFDVPPSGFPLRLRRQRSLGGCFTEERRH